MKQAIQEKLFDKKKPYISQTEAIKRGLEVCDEAFTFKVTQQAKKGYDPLNPVCISCQGALACLALGHKDKGFEARILLIKQELGVKHFYDESRVKELALVVIDKVIALIKEEGSMSIEEIKEELDYIATGPHQEDDTLYLRSEDPLIPILMYEKIEAHPHIKTEGENLVYVQNPKQ